MMLRLNKKSRMKREFHVRFCEGFGVKFRLTHSTISQLDAAGDTFFSSTDIAYLIFLLIGVVGYACVPSVANYVVHAGGGNTVVQKVNSIISGTSSAGMRAGSAGAGMAADGLGDLARKVSQGYSGQTIGDYFPEGANAHQRDKLSGK